jgi:energy-coupling factor transporter ATP-binding protein EcfA2
VVANPPVSSQTESPPLLLNEQQQAAVRALQQFLSEDEKKLFLLAGYPGTGKSTTIVQVVRLLIAGAGLKVVLTAPTNKAVAVLKQMASEQGLRVDCMTIHQLLGLSLVKRGKEKALERTSPSYLELFDLVVVDECSMVNRDLWDWIQQAVSNLRCRSKIVLMGDPAQLNPVNELKSPSFTVPDKAILTQVVRQGDGNPLLEVLKRCRQAMKQRSPFQPLMHTTEDRQSGMVLVNSTTLLNYACKRVQQFEQEPNRFRILCWTNKRVDYYNRLLRRQLYGNHASRFLVSERLITMESATAPDGKMVVLPTSIEFTITNIEEQRYEGYRTWCLTVLPDSYETERQLYILHEDEQLRFDSESQRLLNDAKRNPFLWRRYYRHLETFAQVRPCFALTVHNSQGSTFEEVGIDGDDLRKRLGDGDRSSIREYNRLFYVGASRAKRRVLVAWS